MSEITTAPALVRRYTKRPRVGDLVVTSVGLGRVERVQRHGEVLTLATAIHGEWVMERATIGSWLTYSGPGAVLGAAHR